MVNPVWVVLEIQDRAIVSFLFRWSDAPVLDEVEGEEYTDE